MRCVIQVPASQLRSVSYRYRRPRSRVGDLAGGARQMWRYVQPTQRDGIRADSEDPIARRQRVEAVLLLSREPLNSRRLAQYASLEDGTEARTVVRQLNELYDLTGRAFRVEEIAGGFRLLTRRRFAPWLRRLEFTPPQVRLSAPAMETLAVVAYRQPVLRAEIEAIRGVNCGEILRQLMERELVRIGGRSDELGRPYLYTTTKRFLQLFGLQSLDDLPRALALRDRDGSTDHTSTEAVNAPVSTDEAQQEQEKSEVSVQSPTQLPVDELLEEMSSKTAVALEGSYDSDEYEDVEYEEDDEYEDDDDDDEYDDDEEEDDEEDYDDEYEDDEEEYEDDEDGFEDDEWEEVEDDDEEEDDSWEDDEDEEWDDEYEEDDYEEYEDDDDEEWE